MSYKSRKPQAKNYNLYSGRSKLKFPVIGMTTDNANHRHRFVINKDGSVEIHQAVHPQYPSIKHSHQYIGLWPKGYVTQNASSCYPDCLDGAPPHSHNIILTNKINNYGRKGDSGNCPAGQRCGCELNPLMACQENQCCGTPNTCDEWYGWSDTEFEWQGHGCECSLGPKDEHGWCIEPPGPGANPMDKPPSPY